MRAHILADETARKRFRKEALALSKLKHPNITTVYDFDTQDGVDFLVMEYVAGATLTKRITDGALPEKEVAQLGIQIAAALEEAQEQGVVHRDLKPGNVMVTPKGQAKVLDFGLAKLVRPLDDTALTASLTETPAAAGTLPYMPPEQLRGKPVDVRADLYALGAVLYEMGTGQRAFPERESHRLITAILHETPQPPSALNREVSAGLESIIFKALEKDPERRYQSAQELRVDLERLSGPEPFLATPRRPGLTRRQLVAMAGAALVALLAVPLGLNVGGLRDRILGTATAPRIRSIAVLPLANLSGDPEQDYFADGMTEALITDLGKIAALRVISRRSVMRYRGSDKSLQEIARELNVDAVVEGSALRSGDRVRITAQLIHVATDSQLWSERYERNLRDILVLQGEVTTAIAREIKVKLTPQQQTRLASTRQVNPATHEAYLRGMFWLNKATPEGAQKGMAYLREAVEKDPGDPLAYAGLALGYITLAHGPAPPKDALPLAKAATEKALELDDMLAEALAASAFLKGYYGWEWEVAQQTLDRALEINPSLAIAHYHNSWFHALFGRMDEAIAEHKRAQELDPLMPLHTAWLGALYLWEGRYEEAIEEARKSIEINPNYPVGHFVLGLVYRDKGMYEEAIAAHQKVAEVAPPWKWALGCTYAAAGRTDEARKLLDELKEQEVTRWRAYWLAELHTALGEKDEAFRWLNYEHLHAWVPWVRVIPEFEPLRDDPRFQDLLRRMNLPHETALPAN